MKQPRCIFVDDGSPEASDYDNNYVCYDATSSESCKQALLDVQRRRGTMSAAPSSSGPAFRLESENSTRAGLSGTPAAGVKRSGLSVLMERFRDGWAGLFTGC
ncbi:MAG: hypothetical protein WCL44_03470 [bacterium]